MTSLRKWFRRLRTLVWTALALVIIGAAVMVGIGKLLMPYSERFKPRLEAVLAEQFNQPVRLDAFTGEWKAFGPRISLEGVNLLGGPDGTGALAIERAALDIKPLNVFLSNRPLYSFRIIGVDLVLVHTVDGQWELSGLGLSGRRLDEEAGDSERSGLSNLARVGEVRLQESRFAFRDDVRNLQLQLTGINGRLQLRGDRLALELQASVTDPQTGLVLSDIAATVKTELVDGRRPGPLAFHVETGELMMDEIASQLPQHPLMPVSGRVNAQLWGDWTPGAPLEIVGVADLRDAGLDTGETQLLLDHMNTRLKWRWHDKTQWRIDLADARVEENGRSWLAPRISVERNLDGGVAAWVGADALQAEFPLEAVQVFMKELGYRWPKAAPTAGRGRVSDFDLVINGNRKLAAVSGEFEELDVLAWGPWPLPRGLSGRIDLAFGEGSLHFSGEDVAVHWDRNFRRPLIADFNDCEVEILWDEQDNWQIDALPCDLSNEFIDGEARVRFAKDPGKPRVDVNAHIRRADLSGLGDYWPESVMRPKVTGWLQRSLKSGEVADTRFVLQGDMDRFPFRDGDGVLLAEAHISGASLAYAPGWPEAAAVDASVRFDGPSLVVDGAIGDIAGASVQAATVRIADLQAPVLRLDYRSDTDLVRLRGFLEASPLLGNAEFDIKRLVFEGPARTEGVLRIPLGTSPGETTVFGVLEVTDGLFTEQETGLRLEGLTGTVDYTRTGLVGRDLDVLYGGWPAVLQMDAAWESDTPVDIRMAGRFPASLLIAATPLSDDPMLTRISGEAAWTLGFAVERSMDEAPAEIWLDVGSDLSGVSLDLPAPLNKAADSTWPLALRYPLNATKPVMRLDLADRFALALELAQLDRAEPGAPEPGNSGAAGTTSPVTAMDEPQPNPILRAAASFGGVPAALPAAGVFSLGGRADHLDVDGWVELIVDYAQSEGYAGGLAVRDAELRADELLLLNRPFADVLLDLKVDEQQLDARFDGDSIAGDLRYQRNPDGTQALSAQFDRLWLPTPTDGGVRMDTDPTALPEMRFYVRDFEYLGLKLGETRIEAYPIADGLHIETVDAVSEQLSFQARGDWTLTDGGSRSDFDIVMTSESLGSLVNALDLSSVLEGGQTMVRYDAWWPGPPAAFELARLNGLMSFSVVDGRILNADPGAGRVLGLMSLGALPRRLALDFSDVFESGFGFDQAVGTINFDSGRAHTDDFVMESTAATLTIAGSSNLEAKEFDYLMSIKPGVSQALPVIGAIAAGPAGVAAGLALQELLREALGEATEARYSISGPWSDPQVVRLDTTPPPAPENSTAQNQPVEGT